MRDRDNPMIPVLKLSYAERCSSRKSAHRGVQVDQLLERATSRAREEGSSSTSSMDSPTPHRIYCTGDTVAESGIYEGVCTGNHSEPHHPTLIAGELFPGCEICKQVVCYRLVRAVPYIFHDKDFQKE